MVRLRAFVGSGAVEDLIHHAAERLRAAALDAPREGQHARQLVGRLGESADRVRDDGALRLASLRGDLPEAGVHLGGQGDLPPDRAATIVYRHKLNYTSLSMLADVLGA